MSLLPRTLPKVKVTVAFDSDPGAASPVRTDVSAYVERISIERGKRSDPKDISSRIEPGVCDVLLRNTDRRFDPWYGAGPYYNKLLPAKELQVTIGENLLGDVGLDTSFENNLTGWGHSHAGTSPSFIRQVGIDPLLGLGSYAAWMTATMPATGWWNGIYPTSTAVMPVISPGKKYTFSFWAYSYVPSGKQVVLRYEFLNSSGGLVTTGYVDPDGSQDGYVYTVLGSSASSWIRYKLSTVAAPAGAAYLSFLIYEGGSTSGLSDWLIDGVQVWEGTDDQPWVAKSYTLFTGDIEGWPQTWEKLENTVRVVALDALDALKTSDVPDDTVLTANPSGTQLGALLDAIGYPSGAAYRALDTGQAAIAAHTFGANEDALNYAQQIAVTEMGYLYADGKNKIVFLQRHKIAQAPYTTIKLTLSNRPDFTTKWPFADVEDPDLSYRTIVNDAIITPVGQDAVQVTDSPSVTKYRRRSKSISTLHSNANESLDMANYLVTTYKEPQAFIEGVVIEPQQDGALYDYVLARELAERVALEIFPPPGRGGASTLNMVIQSIRFEYEVGRMTVKWGTSPPLQDVVGSSIWTLGTSTLGDNTYLGF